MELFFPDISITIRFSRLTTRSGRKAFGIALPSHFSHLKAGRGSLGLMTKASSKSTSNSALHCEHLTEELSTILQSRSAAMPYQLSEARKAASASVWLTLNSEGFRLNLFGFAEVVVVCVLLDFYNIRRVRQPPDSQVLRNDLSVHPADLLCECVGAGPGCPWIQPAADSFRVKDGRAQSPL